MADITVDGERLVVASTVKDFEARAQAALDQIAADEAVLASGPTNAQVIGVLENILARQRKEVKVLRKIIRKMAG